LGADRRRGSPADRSERGRLIRNAAARRRGQRAEIAACRHLQEHGLRLLARNYRTRRGEIDLIMLDGKVIVFVEVRSRARAEFLHPADSVDARKRGHLLLAARHYLQSERLQDSTACRFDVVSLTGEIDTGKIEWIKNAFEA
jgi:putative endonuclease